MPSKKEVVRKPANHDLRKSSTASKWRNAECIGDEMVFVSPFVNPMLMLRARPCVKGSSKGITLKKSMKCHLPVV